MWGGWRLKRPIKIELPPLKVAPRLGIGAEFTPQHHFVAELRVALDTRYFLYHNGLLQLALLGFHNVTSTIASRDSKTNL